MNGKYLASTIAVIGLLSLACGGGDDDGGGSDDASADAGSDNKKGKKKAKKKGTQANPYAMNEAGVVASLETTVVEAKSKKKVKKSSFQKYAAGEGAKLIVVKYKVKNVGKEPKTCMSFADSVIDSEGIQYDDVTECNMAINSWMMEKVNPNLMKTYEGCFEVPEGAKGFKLKFNCSLEDMYVDLGI